MAAKFVLEKVAGSRFRFRLMSQGRVLASSESYTTKRAAQNAIASIRTTAPSAQIDDTTQVDAGKARATSAAGGTPAAKAPAKRTAKRTTKRATKASTATPAAKAPAKRTAKRATKAAKK